MSIVVTSSERLHLEIIDESHFENLCLLLNNPIVHQYFPKTLDRKEALEFYKKAQKRQDVDGYSFWAVIRKSDQQFIGICGLLKQEIDGVSELEVGYRLDNKFWGQGYATEAARACMAYAKDTLKAKRIISIITQENKPSIKVALRNGLSLEKEAIFHATKVNIYSTLLGQ